MFILDLLSWWYLESWSTLNNKMAASFKASANFFSIGSLIPSLFKPYKQNLTSGAGVKQTLGQKLSDALVSRAVGFFIRLTLIFAGLITLLVQLLIFALSLVLWPLLPLSPLILVALSLINFGF